MSRRADELRDLLVAATREGTRRRYFHDCAQRLLVRYEERYGAPIADRGIFEAALAAGPSEAARLPQHRALLAYADTVSHEPAAQIARAVATALATPAESWRLAVLLPEVSPTPPVDRAWARQHLLELLDQESSGGGGGGAGGPGGEGPGDEPPRASGQQRVRFSAALRYGAPPPPGVSTRDGGDA